MSVNFAIDAHAKAFAERFGGETDAHPGSRSGEAALITSKFARQFAAR
jgi:hypothetical protein